MGGLLRQITQLSLDLFTRLLYIYFLTVFTSGTFLFVELCVTWGPRLKDFHFNDYSRKCARFTLMGLFLLAIGGILYIPIFQKSNFNYLQALAQIGLGKDPQQAIGLFEKVEHDSSALYMNATYRIARIYQLRYHDYDKAIQYFQRVVDNTRSPLRDDAIYQILLCKFLEGKTGEDLSNYFNSASLGSSCLLDEAMLLIARKYEQENRLQAAVEIYTRLMESSVFRFTLQSYSNSNRRFFRQTRYLAQQKYSESSARLPVNREK